MITLEFVYVLMGLMLAGIAIVNLPRPREPAAIQQGGVLGDLCASRSSRARSCRAS